MGVDDCGARRRLAAVGAYENLVLDTIAAALEPGQPATVDHLARLVAPRVDEFFSRDERHPSVDVWLVTLLLRASARFVEVAPGVWMRRDDGPEAGVPVRPRQPPVAGSAAAEATPPERNLTLDAVGGEGGRATVATG
jgi:hypothetical protein